jgi:hypothetical protein
MVKIGDIVYIIGGNPENLGIVTEINQRNGKDYVTIDKGWRVIHSYLTNRNGRERILKSDTVGLSRQDLINRHYDFKFSRAVEKGKIYQANYYKTWIK